MIVAFAELPVANQSRAKTFYIDKLGCELAADAPMGAGDWRWIEVRFPGAETALHFIHRPDDTPSEGPVLVFVTEDLPATVRQLAAKGVTIVKDTAPAPWNPQLTVAEINDSEGNRIVLLKR